MEVVIMGLWVGTIVEKNSAPFSKGEEPISNGISIRGNSCISMNQ